MFPELYETIWFWGQNAQCLLHNGTLAAAASFFHIQWVPRSKACGLKFCTSSDLTSCQEAAARQGPHLTLSGKPDLAAAHLRPPYNYITVPVIQSPNSKRTLSYSSSLKMRVIPRMGRLLSPSHFFQPAWNKWSGIKYWHLRQLWGIISIFRLKVEPGFKVAGIALPTFYFFSSLMIQYSPIIVISVGSPLPLTILVFNWKARNT